MAVDVTPVFLAYFARNRGPVPGDPEARQPPDYGVSATLDGGVIDLDLTFRGGSAYCCYEWGCHLGLPPGKRWDWLRRELAARGVLVPDRLELRITVVVEAGAMFFDWSRPEPSPRGRGWYAFAPVEAMRYQHNVVEACNPDAEPGAPADPRRIS
ncbi:MAG: hypothetical protein IRY99_20630 [Isosphaeraceae bacterium]|nr:hypothetical protein [Isosphaeraceae bacterium]